MVGTDPKTDLALLKVEGKDFPFVELAPQAPRVGDWVVAVGNPFGLGGTVTAGIVSARGRDIGAGPYDDFLQIDAPINRGNSGGPAFNGAGQVVGVNTAIASPSGGNVGVAFAIPSETVGRIVAQLKETGTVARGFLGVQIQPVTKDIAASLGLSEAEGAIVASVGENSPAAKAGVKSGDVVLALNGKPVKAPRDLSRGVADLGPDADATLQVWRDGAKREVGVKLGRLSDGRTASADPKGERSETIGPLGLELAPAASVGGSETKGVAVTDVRAGSPAAEKGFRTGDVIAEVAGRAVETPADVKQAPGRRAQGRQEGRAVPGRDQGRVALHRARGAHRLSAVGEALGPQPRGASRTRLLQPRRLTRRDSRRARQPCPAQSRGGRLNSRSLPEASARSLRRAHGLGASGPGHPGPAAGSGAAALEPGSQRPGAAGARPAADPLRAGGAAGHRHTRPKRVQTGSRGV